MLKDVRSLQLAWFTTGAESATPLRLFNEMFGREPDGFQKLQPPQVPFPITAQMLIEDGVEHKIQSYSGRVDYFVSRIQDSPELPVLPLGAEAHLSKALEVAARGANAIGNINRAAIVLTLSEKIASFHDGAQFFSKLFGGLLNFDGQTDLQFQTNSRVKAELIGLDVNRLARWTCDSLQFQQIVNLAGAPNQTIASELVDLIYLNYVIDINTVPSSDVHPPSAHQGIFSALASSAMSLANISKIQDI